MDPASLADVRRWMTRYIMTGFLSFGLLGNLINVFLFKRKDFLSSSCSIYLLAASIVNLLTISWGIGPSLYTLDNVDPSTYSYLYCKFRLYTIHTLLMIGRSLIVSACFDRYALCSGSLYLRSFSRPKIAVRCIIVTLFIWPILTVHIAILQNFLGNRCGMTGVYVLIHGIYATFAAGICPPLLMTIFSLLTVRHRRELQLRLNTTGKEKKRDHAMLVMLMSQVIVYVITTSLYPAVTLYLAITNGDVKSVPRTQIESFLSFIGGSFLIYLNPSSPFYVYWITSKNFRKEIKQMLIIFSRRILRRGRQIDMVTTQIHNETNTIHRSHAIER